LKPALCLAWCLAVAPPPPKARVYDSTQLSDMLELGRAVRRSVAYLRIEVAPDKDLIDDPVRDGYAIVLEPDLLATVSFVVERAKSIAVVGAKDASLRAEVLAVDPERRIALLRTKAPLSTIGLVPAVPSPKAERKVDDAVFALVSPSDDVALVSGSLLDPGETPEYGEHPRASLKLGHGSPVFDDRGRFLGLSRTAAWDADRQLLISPEMIAAARAARSAPPARTKPDR
jgi:hypothetical protein